MITIQPFRAPSAALNESTLLHNETIRYDSQVWPELSFEYRGHQHHIVMRSPQLLDTWSSAVYAGGRTQADHIINGFVHKNYHCGDPVTHLRSDLMTWGYPLSSSVGLLTAAKITLASIAEAEGDQCAIVCCTTAGTSNAARAGRERQVFSAYELGTINTIVAIDGRVAPAALVGAILTATEAKVAALQDLGIADPQDGSAATGTTTDTIVVAASQSDRYANAEHQYAGTATTLGNLLAQLVYQTVYEAVRTQGEA